jgi:regulator of replication initiation timing
VGAPTEPAATNPTEDDLSSPKDQLTRLLVENVKLQAESAKLQAENARLMQAVLDRLIKADAEKGAEKHSKTLENQEIY